MSKQQHNITVPPYDFFPKISGDRVSLREILISDIKDIVEISFYDAVQASSIEQATEMQAKIDEDYHAGNSIHWAIEENVNNNIVGTCGYYRGFENAAGELGCVLLPYYQGQGYMTEAMFLAIQFGKNEIGLKRIWAATTKDNWAAIRLFERLDFQRTISLNNTEIEFELRR